MTSTLRVSATITAILLVTSPLCAHHGAFYKAVFRAIEKTDLEAIKDLCAGSAWEGKVGDVSAEQLQEKLEIGELIPKDRTNALVLCEHSSNDARRSKCLVYFKLRHEDEDRPDEFVFLLSERVDFSDTTNSNCKAWQIVRIVTDQKQAECFLGRKL